MLKTLYNKLMFIEDDFVSLMSKKVKKEAFYDDVKEMMQETYKIEKTTNKDDTQTALELLKSYTELAYFAKTESEDFVNKARLFADDKEKKKKKDSEKLCEESVAKTCAISDHYNILYFTMLFYGLLLLALVSL